MANIRTMEDGFQYRVHHIIKRLKKEIEANSSKMSIAEYLETRNGKIDLAEALLEDIDNYCGLDEAIENEF